MATIHYLNVKNGDCSIIQHNDRKVSVIDVNNADEPKTKSSFEEALKKAILSGSQNKNQKDYPVNPIHYMTERGIDGVFRFILTHPDMDHMDGIKAFFNHFQPANFWDTDNTKEDMDFDGSPYNEEDWEFYKSMRDGKVSTPNRLTLYSGAKGQFYNIDSEGKSGGNGLYILAPTAELLSIANKEQSFNDSSYVILYKVEKRKILFGGDADDRTWTYLLENHENDISNVDLLIAPHHGRKSSCTYEFLRTVNPKITFFGNADKESHLAHDMFKRLRLERITNNQGNCLIADISSSGMHIYVTHEAFAKQYNSSGRYNSIVKGYYVKSIT